MSDRVQEKSEVRISNHCSLPGHLGPPDRKHYHRLHHLRRHYRLLLLRRLLLPMLPGLTDYA